MYIFIFKIYGLITLSLFSAVFCWFMYRMYFHWYMIITKRWIQSHPTLKSTKPILYNIKAVSHHFSPKRAPKQTVISCTFSWKHERTAGWIWIQLSVFLILGKNRAIQKAYAVAIFFMVLFTPVLICPKHYTENANSEKKKNQDQCYAFMITFCEDVAFCVWCEVC